MMKSLMLLLKAVLTDVGTICDVDTSRDLETVTRRVETEGFPFLGITLPAFGAAFEASLEAGRVDDAGFQSFRKSRGLPVFLQGFLRLVFDSESGVILEEPDPSAVFAVRQVCYLFQKVDGKCSEKRQRASVRSYLECEQDVRDWTKSYRYDSELRSDVMRISRLLFGDLFSFLERGVSSQNLDLAHGPGKTANGLMGNQKWFFKTWTARLEKVFKMDASILPSPRYWSYLEGVDILEPGRELPVKVTLVPKTVKSPRIIAQEPSWMMYCQKGVQALWYRAVDSGRFLSSDFHGFQSQEPNRLLCQMASAERKLATLDLSEASDRVSLAVVADMLKPFPSLREMVFACRSTKAALDNGTHVQLMKFASMGSALCFPVEAAVFLIAIFKGIEEHLSTPLTHEIIKGLRGRVRVYGDDIIVPEAYVTSIIESLRGFGLLVNSRKSFWNGKFRESCGADYFDGVDVTVIRLRSDLPSDRQDASLVERFSEFRNNAYNALLWETARYCDSILFRLLTFYPAVAPTSPALGRTSVLGYDTEYFHPTLHSPRVKAWRVRNKLPSNPLDDVWALLKVFASGGEEPFDVSHLKHSGRPKSATLSLRGTQPF